MGQILFKMMERQTNGRTDRGERDRKADWKDRRTQVWMDGWRLTEGTGDTEVWLDGQVLSRWVGR